MEVQYHYHLLSEDDERGLKLEIKMTELSLGNRLQQLRLELYSTTLGENVEIPTNVILVLRNKLQ